MARFVAKKQLLLDFLGDGWKGAYLELAAATFNDTRAIAGLSKDETATDQTSAEVIKFLQSHFIAGKAWDGKELVVLTADDLGELPVEAINKALEATIGTPSPNS